MDTAHPLLSAPAGPRPATERTPADVDAGARAAVSELARRLVESGEAPPAAALGRCSLALAWALKDLCYAAWSSEPQRAARAADALQALCVGGTGDASGAAREVEALAAWTAGIAHVTRGQMAEAARAFDRAAAGFRELGQHHHAAATQVPKILALSMLGQYEAAIACAEAAQRDFVALGDVRAAGKVSLNLGALHLRRGDCAESARRAREAAVLFARVGDREHSVMADINGADALAALGDFDEALRIFARARMRAGAHGFPVLQALVDESVALVQLARGRYRDALAGFEGSRRQYEQLAMPQHLAIAEKQLADAYLELRLLPEALALFERVLERFRALDMPDEQAWTLAQRGRAQALLERRGAAAASFEQAAALFAAQGSALGECAVRLARAELALAGGEPVDALALATQAARGYVAAGSAEGRFRVDVVRAQALLATGAVEQARAVFDTTLARARELQLLGLQVRCLTGLGLAAQALGHPGLARASFTDAIALFEDQRRALPGDDLRTAFLGDHLRPYRELLRMALNAHGATPTRHHAVEVLQQLERFRARALDERLAQGPQPPAPGPADALRERVQWLARRVQRLEDEGEASEALTAELRRTEMELLEQARRARLAAPAPQRTGEAADAFSVARLQASLGDDEALVEYGVLDDELFACIVTRDGIDLHRALASWSDVLDGLRSARFQVEALRHGAAPVRGHMDVLTARAEARLARLHALVWAPLAQALAGRRRVLVVPHAQLGTLPFAALGDGEHPLAQRHELAIVPSARLALRGLRQAAATPRQVLALGESSRLPHAAQEARFVAGLFPQGRACVGAEATIEALQAHAGCAEVVHLACHAHFRSDNPMFSALELHDGALTVERAEALALQPGLVVLSACETGLAELGSGDEMVGLVRAFLAGGAARVLASLWTVDDAVTARFMAAFYGALRRGARPAAALRLAQLEIRQTHPHPFFWAAFSLHGGW